MSRPSTHPYNPPACTVCKKVKTPFGVCVDCDEKQGEAMSPEAQKPEVTAEQEAVSKSLLATKEAITKSLFAALKELKLRAFERKSSIQSVQRMYGVVLGLRIALMDLNRQMGLSPNAFAGSLGIDHLMRSEFGEMSRKEIMDYEFPEF